MWIQASRGRVNAERGGKGAAARRILQGYLPGEFRQSEGPGKEDPGIKAIDAEYQGEGQEG